MSQDNHFNPTQLTRPNSDVNFPAVLGSCGSAKVLRGANGYPSVSSKWCGGKTSVCGGRNDVLPSVVPAHILGSVSASVCIESTFDVVMQSLVSCLTMQIYYVQCVGKCVVFLL